MWLGWRGTTYERRPDLKIRPIGELWHQRTSGFASAGHLHRSAHPGDHSGNLRLPASPRNRRTALSWVKILTRCPAGPAHGSRGAWQRTAWRPSSSERDGVTPTPVISRAILVYNRNVKRHLADGIVITPSHNPPEDGGFKYNPTNGGPADTDVTHWVEDGPTNCCAEGNADVKRMSVRKGNSSGDYAPGRFRSALCSRSKECRGHGRDPRRQASS